MERTISAMIGKGSVNHNTRAFTAKNVDKNRSADNVEFCQEDIFVCSCDMPFVSSDLIENILQKKVEYRINVVRFGEKIYPVVGIYPFSILNDLKKTIENGNLRMTSFLEQQNAHYIDFEDSFEHQLLNINTPENFKTAEKIIKSKLK